MARVAALILAAGQGTRFEHEDEESKLLAKLVDKPIVLYIVETALASQASPVIVVTGHAESRVAAALAGLPIEIVCNANYKDGMAASLQTGLMALPEGIDGVLVLLADMPFVELQTLDAMIARFEREPDRATLDAIVPYFEGKAGNPMLIGRRLFADVMQLKGDRGARRLIFEPGRAVLPFGVDDPNIHLDIDTLEMYVGLGGTA